MPVPVLHGVGRRPLVPVVREGHVVRCGIVERIPVDDKSPHFFRPVEVHGEKDMSPGGIRPPGAQDRTRRIDGRESVFLPARRNDFGLRELPGGGVYRLEPEIVNQQAPFPPRPARDNELDFTDGLYDAPPGGAPGKRDMTPLDPLLRPFRRVVDVELLDPVDVSLVIGKLELEVVGRGLTPHVERELVVRREIERKRLFGNHISGDAAQVKVHHEGPAGLPLPLGEREFGPLRHDGLPSADIRKIIQNPRPGKCRRGKSQQEESAEEREAARND